MNPKNLHSEATDWTAYYSNPKSRFSSVTQKITLRELLFFIERYRTEASDIMELGGGNSCFAQELIANCKVPIKSYSIVDSCNIAVEKFKMMKLPGEAYLADITSDTVSNAIDKRFDVVYSVGLIEHFRGKEIAQIIKAHFQLCKAGGLVLISVPTPTIKYRLLRKIMELLKVWRFPDEKPLCYSDIREIIEQYGTVTQIKVNKKLPLTQLIVVALNKKP